MTETINSPEIIDSNESYIALSKAEEVMTNGVETNLFEKIAMDSSLTSSAASPADISSAAENPSKEKVVENKSPDQTASSEKLESALASIASATDLQEAFPDFNWDDFEV